MPDQPSLTCLLLTHSYRDRNGQFEMTLYCKCVDGNVVRISVNNFLPLFFVSRDTPAELTRLARKRRALDLKSMDGRQVDCLYFATQPDLQRCARDLRRAGQPVFESDVHPVERYLMERLVAGGLQATGPARQSGGVLTMQNPTIRGGNADVALSTLSFDIETRAKTNQLYSIACSGATDIVFIIGDGSDAGNRQYCGGERELLRRFVAHVAEQDPDILIGWNVLDFDLSVIQARCESCGVPFDLGREPGARILPPSRDGARSMARIPGRVVMDVPVMLRAYFHTFEEYSLDYVAAEMLGEHKSIEATGQEKIDEINRLFEHDKEALASYNLKDAVLTKRIFEKANILSNALQRAKRSGLLLDRTGGSVAAFDYLYLPLLHRQGRVARDVADISPPPSPLPGGYVMESRPGIYENVLLLDFRSLYPTIIMTFRIDPLGYIDPDLDRIQGPAGPSFSRTRTILPAIIADLMHARSEAKRTRNLPLSQAIKILMNSFYGVLGSTGCRFFSSELAAAITGIGRYILRTTCAHIEETTPYSVIYGDTDSLFVLLGPSRENEAKEIGRRIVEETNAWLTRHVKEQFKAESALDLEFEAHFRRFFMPTIRGSAQGSKKRYCGGVEEGGKLSLVFKGLESARSDWTELAKDFQRELFMRLFSGMPLDDYIVNTAAELRRGEHDKRLVYRKGVRKNLEEYTDHVPPHIQAARLLHGAQPSRISYVMTVEGPQPVQGITAPLDYDHYIEAQLKPIADSVLEWNAKSFDTLVSGQQDLFA